MKEWGEPASKNEIDELEDLDDSKSKKSGGLNLALMEKKKSNQK